MTIAKNLFALVLTVGVLGMAYLYYQQSLPCGSVITFRVADVDPRFGIAPAAVTEEALEAAAIWNAAAGKTLVVYDPEGEVVIRLTYDERQATFDEADRLEAKHAELEAWRKRIERSPSRESVDEYNQAVQEFNARIDAFNATAGEAFDQGQYVSDASGKRITIYEFENRDDLMRVLAHEFGHSIGLEHNEDPSSIMYSFNEKGNNAPSAADLASLKALCGLPA